MKTARDILYEFMDKGDPQYEEDTIKMMEDYAKEVAIDILNWVTSEEAPYAILYGNQPERFATVDEDYTSEQVFEIYKKH